MSPGAGWLVWFSNPIPTSNSPSGIHVDSPLQRTWMTFCANGRSFVNAAHVFGARSSSSRALNAYGQAVIDSMDIGSALLGCLEGDDAAGRRRDDPAISDDGAPAHERADDPSAEGAPGPRALLVALVQRLGGELRRAGQVDEREVGVGARLEPALAGQAQPPRGARRGEPGDPLERDPARVVAFVEQRAEQRLDARDPAPVGERVRGRLELRGRG